MKKAIARYTIGTITTKDLKLWERTRELMSTKSATLEDIVRRGVESISQDSIGDLTQNNIA